MKPSLDCLKPGMRFLLKDGFVDGREYFMGVQVIATTDYLGVSSNVTFGELYRGVGSWWCSLRDIKSMIPPECVCANAWFDEACCCGAVAKQPS